MKKVELQASKRLSAAQGNLVHDTVIEMIDCIGRLRKFVAIDQMPPKLQQVRQLLRELDHELETKRRQESRR